MIEIKQIAKGQNGRTWVVGIDNSIWCLDPGNPTGLSGDTVTFRLPTGLVNHEIIFSAKGPWCGNEEDFKKDTGLSLRPPRRRRVKGLPPFGNLELRQQYEQELVLARETYARSLRGARNLKTAAKLFAPIFAVKDQFSSVWSSDKTCYVRVRGTTKADFTDAVREIRRDLGVAPDIKVDTREYIADFPLGDGYRVHVYLQGAADCKTIEQEVTLTKILPHPECLAALKTLEDE